MISIRSGGVYPGRHAFSRQRVTVINTKKRRINRQFKSKQLTMSRIDTILQEDQQQIPPAPIGIEKTMVSKTLPAAAPDLCF
jgi:hypothetical protein